MSISAVSDPGDSHEDDERTRKDGDKWEPVIPTLPADRALARAQIETLTWPDMPLRAHAGDWNASAFGPPLWSAPHGRYRYVGQKGYPDDCPAGGYDENYRTCSYCGSMHPQDLARLVLDAPDPATLPPLPPEPFEAMRIWEREHPTATMDQHMMAHDAALQAYYTAKRTRLRIEGADWKYGWPHKFYVEGIPNPAAGQPACMGSHSESYMEHGEVHVRVTPHIQPAPETMTAKWYNTHFNDLDGATFDFMAALIHQSTGILFYRRPAPADPNLPRRTTLYYHAPHRGYQP